VHACLKTRHSDSNAISAITASTFVAPLTRLHDSVEPSPWRQTIASNPRLSRQGDHRMPVTGKHTDAEKQQEVLRQAKALYTEKADWATFYREILGTQGVIRKLFSTRTEVTKFEQSKAYREIQRMLTRLRRKGAASTKTNETTKVITVRLPESVHEALIAEAYEHHTSVNKLCISKLLQFIDAGMVPKNHK
jgi:predicted HicB family RNase H-like nuclease